MIYRCNEILWRCLPEYESVKTYGRRGQHQHGVDLTGICVGALELIVGVQCERVRVSHGSDVWGLVR